MKKHLSLAIAFLMVCGIVGLIAQQTANISGEWEMKSQTPRGDERTSTIKFEQDGENLKFTTQGFRGDEVTGTGTIKGNDIEWTIVRTRPDGQEFKITYKGTVDGDTMKGTVEFGPMGSSEWTAKKKTS